MASASKKFTPLKKCACNLHEPQHIARVLLAAGVSSNYYYFLNPNSPNKRSLCKLFSFANKTNFYD